MSDLRQAAQEALDHLQDWERGGIDTKIIDTLLAALAADSVAAEAVLRDALRQCLVAMDAARDAIQPITQAQMKLHRLNPQTDKLLDDAAEVASAALRASPTAAPAVSEPLTDAEVERCFPTGIAASLVADRFWLKTFADNVIAAHQCKNGIKEG